VSLEGSLETIALPDVLGLLSRAAKSGELWVNGESTGGCLQFSGGDLAGYSVQGARGPVDALFSLLRLETGSFEFETGVFEPTEGMPHSVETLLEQAQDRLAKWGPISEVIPSLACWLSLSDALPASLDGEDAGQMGDGTVLEDGTVSLTAAQWALVVAIGDGRSVGETLQRRDLGEFDGCDSVKDLVELGLVAVSEESPEPPAVAAEPQIEVPEPALLSQAVTGDDVVIEADDLIIDAGDLRVPEGGLVVNDGEVVLQGSDMVLPEAPAPAPAEAIEYTPGYAGGQFHTLAAAAPETPAATEAPASIQAPAAAPDEQINRGLLLKFLSTVRT